MCLVWKVEKNCLLNQCLLGDGFGTESVSIKGSRNQKTVMLDLL